MADQTIVNNISAWCAFISFVDIAYFLINLTKSFTWNIRFVSKVKFRFWYTLFLNHSPIVIEIKLWNWIVAALSASNCCQIKSSIWLLLVYNLVIITKIPLLTVIILIIIRVVTEELLLLISSVEIYTVHKVKVVSLINRAIVLLVIPWKCAKPVFIIIGITIWFFILMSSPTQYIMFSI